MQPPMVHYVVRADATEPGDWSGTAFGHLDIRTLVSEDRQHSEKMMVGQTIYPPGQTHEHHQHPDAEEVVIVLSGTGWHRVGSEYYDIGPGDVVYVPVKTAHSAGADEGDEPMVILWVLGGAPSLAKAGYEAVEDLPRTR
jgi:quercetin dioxygenase-like cupin family protein